MALRRLSPFSSGVNLGVLAALAGVGLAAYPVHRDGERLVRLPGDGAEGHGPGREALDDLTGRLDLLYGMGFSSNSKRPRSVAKRALCSSKWLAELLEGLEAPRLDGPLQGRDAHLVPLVVLALRPELVLAPDVELLRVVLGRRESAPVALERLARQGVHPDAADAGSGARKVLSMSSSFRPTASKIWAPQ